MGHHPCARSVRPVLSQYDARAGNRCAESPDNARGSVVGVHVTFDGQRYNAKMRYAAKRFRTDRPGGGEPRRVAR